MSFKIERGLFLFDFTDYHAILGIPINLDKDQVRKRYLKVARSLHPDSCQAKNETEKQLANQLLSKLVNPAYEHLHKERSRAEHLLVLTQMGKQLAAEEGKLTVFSKAAKDLSQAGANLDNMYRRSVQILASDQYKNLEQAVENIAQLSELNLIYLLNKDGQKTKYAGSSAKEKQTSKINTEEEKTQSTVTMYLRRAQEYLAKKNYSKAVLELRDGLKIEPNSSSCHSLLGWAYLQQNQIGMAKVHINKALQLNPTEPIAIKSKQALNQIIQNSQTKSTDTSNSAKDNSDSKPSGGLFGGLFGGKKK